MHSNGRDQSLYIDIYNVMVGIASVNATLLKQSMHSYRYWTYFQPDRHCFVSTPPSCPFNKEHKNMFHIHLDAIQNKYGKSAVFLQSFFWHLRMFTVVATTMSLS